MVRSADVHHFSLSMSRQNNIYPINFSAPENPVLILWIPQDALVRQSGRNPGHWLENFFHPKTPSTLRHAHPSPWLFVRLLWYHITHLQSCTPAYQRCLITAESPAASYTASRLLTAPHYTQQSKQRFGLSTRWLKEAAHHSQHKLCSTKPN